MSSRGYLNAMSAYSTFLGNIWNFKSKVIGGYDVGAKMPIVEIPYEDMIKDSSVAQGVLNSAISYAVKVIRSNPKEYINKSIFTVEDYRHGWTWDSLDWLGAVGHYRTWHSLENIECRGGILRGTFTIHFRDVYDWEGWDWLPTIITPSENRELHEYGMAREYYMIGKHVRKITFRG